MYPEIKRLQSTVRLLRQSIICVPSSNMPIAEVEILSDLLKSAPVCDIATKRRWMNIKRVSIELFTKYLKMVDPLYSAVNAVESVFGAWTDEFKNSCAGMRHRKTGASHGVIRAVKLNNWVVEGTYKDGKAHGLVRSLNGEKTVFTLHSEGSQLARIEFDANLEETYRLDPQRLLGELDGSGLRFIS